MGNILTRIRRGNPKERRFSSASSRQQRAIIIQLRETQNRKKGSIRRKKNIRKIVPIAIHVEAKTEENREHQDRKHRKELREEEDAVVEKGENDKRDANEEINLKAALTHPTIVKFLRAFMLAQNSSSILDFYLDALEIRGLSSGRYYKGGQDMYVYLSTFLYVWVHMYADKPANICIHAYL